MSTRVHLQFDGDGRRVRITTTADLMRDSEAGAAKLRLAEAREMIRTGRDEWSNRYAAIEAELESVRLEKQFGDLRRAERVAVFDRDQLHRFFSDTPITLHFTHGDGWTELTIWAGPPSRATREQRANVDKLVAAWSADGARYVAAVGALYEYLDGRPDRAGAVFAMIFGDEKQKPENTTEQALLAEVSAAMQEIITRAEAARENAFSVDEEFDLVFNPFPAAMTVQTPGTILAVENFRRIGDDSVEIPGAGITDALQALEGRWVSPDPLAILSQELLAGGEPARSDPAALAVATRKRTPGVVASDVQQAIAEVLRGASVYRVRWVEPGQR
ncbi:MAG: hypothetical protein ACXW5U_07020 [Thermoanaerobaculia bacterium]